MTAQTKRRAPACANHHPFRIAKEHQMATPTLTEKPRSAEPAPTTPAARTPSGGERRRRGHIGLTVLGSITAGVVLGLVLVLGVFAGGEEPTITGAALVALGAGI